MIEHIVQVPEAPEAVSALVFYQTRSNYGQAGFVTRHDIEQKEGGPQLGPGQILPPSRIRELCNAVTPSKKTEKIHFIPEGLIAQGPDFLAWVSKGNVGNMWFKFSNTEQKVRVPWPTLLYVVHKGGLRLAALSSNRRPNLETRLYEAPLMNVSPGGSVCLGSIKRPKVSLDAIPQWENSVRNTWFSHVNGGPVLCLNGKKYDNARFLAFWKKLETAKASKFPSDRLVPMKKTLRAFLEGDRR